MYKLFILMFLMAAFACRKPDSTTLTGKWKLTAYHNLATATSEKAPANLPRSIIVQFTDNGHTGTLKGHTVTNEVSGVYELMENNTMKTLSFGGTKVAEPDWGNTFWNAIHAASSYQRQGNKLFVSFNAGREQMEFRKQ